MAQQSPKARTSSCWHPLTRRCGKRSEDSIWWARPKTWKQFRTSPVDLRISASGRGSRRDSLSRRSGKEALVFSPALVDVAVITKKPGETYVFAQMLSGLDFGSSFGKAYCRR